MKDDEGKFVTVAGKVSTWCYGRLSRILRKRGLNIYQMIQNFCDSIVRNMDDRHNLTPESEKIMATFEHMIGWEDNFNIGDPNVKPEVSEATYYLTDEDGKKGVRVMHVEKPFFGQWTQNFNIQQILERFMCLTFPQLYKRMRFIAVCRQCASIFELLTEIVAELEEEEKKRELLEDFEDADRGDWGQKPHEHPYRRRHEKSDDTLFKDELI